MTTQRRQILEQWWIAFRVATLIVLMLAGHSFIVLTYTNETSKWAQQFITTLITWYLWAALFPWIYFLAREYSLESGTRIKSAIVHIVAGIATALCHAILQSLLLDQGFASINNLLVDRTSSTLLWRFFIYQSLLAVCIALNSYRRAKALEIRMTDMEAGILQARIEALKAQLNPDFLFRSFRRLSELMHKDLDEVETMVASLGDYLRRKLDPEWTKSAEPLTLNEIQPGSSEQPEANAGYVETNPQRKWLFIILIFTALSIYFTLHRMVLYSSRGMTMNWSQQLLDCTGWYVWGLITPIVLKLSARFPLQQKNWLKHTVIHVAALISCWFFATLVMEAIKWAANLGQYSYLSALPNAIARSPFGLDIICYATIMAVESGLRYRRQFQSGTLRSSKLAAQLALARLQALNMQLHPHFLFNSLNSLSELMREDPVAAEEMLHNLERFLQMTLNQNYVAQIPLGKELEFLTCYLSIEHVRYQDRLSVEIDVEPQTLDVPVPNLLLQPIVENAIRYAIAPRSTPGKIEIHANRMNGVLKISVRDNGPGFQQGKNRHRNRSGLGLSNTRERLMQLYGDSHRFDLINAPEGGLIVALEIPAAARN